MQHAHDSDEQVLIERARSGDHAALEELLARHDVALRQHVDASLSDDMKAFFPVDDVLQETSLEAFLRIKNFDSARAGSFAGWLRDISRCIIIDAKRAHDADKRGGTVRREGRSVSALALDSLLGAVYPARTRSTPSQGARHEEAMKLLDKLIDMLPDDHRRVVRLDLEGMPSESIAAELGKSPGAVYTMRSRAHDELQALIQPHISEFRSFL